MNVTKEYSIAYVQVLEVLKGLSKKEYNRIPKERIYLYEKNKDKEYQFNIDNTRNLNEQLSDEAKNIISNLFVRFIATPKDRKEIYEKEKSKFVQVQMEERKNLKINKLFENKEVKTKRPENQAIIVVKRKGIFGRIIDSLKDFFKIGRKYEW